MKKYIILVAVLFFCAPAMAQKHCVTMDYMQQEIVTNQSYKSILDSVNKMYFSEARKSKKFINNSSKSITTKVRFIPVVFHILYDTILNDIPNQRVYSQLKVLNDDFLAMNANLYKTQPDFVNRIGVTAVQFYIANIAPDGSDTFAIIHKKTTTKNFPFNNDVKHNITKGDDAWDTKNYLNIWVCAITNSGILGYSSFPGTALMNNGNDGTVVNVSNFGLSGHQNAPYHLGRTLTHELGHYLGLYHTFEFGCIDEGDSIKDTPPILNSHAGCDKSSNTCSTDSPDEIDMVENFMDYSDDDCMTMFSKGQVSVMNSVLATVRDSLGYDSTITFTTQIGIENANNENRIVDIYPNPAADLLTINTNEKIVNIGMYNMIGKRLAVTSFIENKNVLKINIESLSQGFYLLQLNFEEGKTQIMKFEKQ